MPCMWAIGNSSPITSGLLSYGVFWIDTGSFAPWRWFYVITGLLTIMFAIAVWFLLPDSTLTTHFLSPVERAHAIVRIKGNHSGIEQKHFKRYQFIEAIKDPKTWLFFFHAWSQEMANGLTNQYSLIIKSFGFTTLQTTLLGIMLVTIPFSERWALIVAIWIRGTGGIPYSVVMVWAANCSAGHTKKTTVIALYHVGYGLGNILSPQLFQPQYRPRYIVTWSVILGVAVILPTFIILVLRWYLQKENARRDALDAQGLVTEVGVLTHDEGDGSKTEKVVDARQLDLTDRQNLAFRYVL
ncbi:hypothetical protein LTR97_012784 [Elasticomyces elasticus]|uniref:Major facilitator superfamily (MFS) profile domain-containing protein n=1 Tax=Elasticomyces elasticus TaxID=574655 RepID=A0AAN7VLR1_9PEZI|nr:hypothetical protein LTR97_012784 [Elasticomyces elasticus]